MGRARMIDAMTGARGGALEVMSRLRPPTLFLLEFGGCGGLKQLVAILLPARHEEFKFPPASLESSDAGVLQLEEVPECSKGGFRRASAEQLTNGHVDTMWKMGPVCQHCKFHTPFPLLTPQKHSRWGMVS